MAAPVVPQPALDPTWHYAVVVGINSYPALRNLMAARQDAESFHSWLKKSGVPEANIKLITTSVEFDTVDKAVPTRQLVDGALFQIMTTLRGRLANQEQMWMKTRLYVYLSGHGVTPNANEAMLLMANAQPGIFGDSFPCSAYIDFFRDVQHFRELVFFADCCRSFVMQTRPVGPPFDYVPRLVGRVNQVVGFATGFGQLAFEPGPAELQDPQNARGFFTQALLEGLNGKAVDRGTQQVNSTSLAKYVRDRVAALTAMKMPAPQEPQMVADPAYPIVFVEKAPVPRYTVTISFAAGFTKKVRLRDSDTEFREEYDPANGPFTVDLVDGLYEVVALDGTPFPADKVFSVRGVPRNVELRS